MNAGKGPGQGPIQEAAEASNTSVGVCDFCATLRPTWRYEAQPFVRSLAGTGVVVLWDDLWAACDACHLLIEADQWARLLRRHKRLNPTAMDAVIAAETAALWMQFEQFRTGPAKRIGGAVS
ncbi:hypothetical protein AB0C70_22925 [Streptomyces sp. NPDC048564]|uniref:hypothetical protein n=1 Tax=Streptomyces sp. NPDC048564 TaxID=3155760 RepID=UPI0034455FBB